MTIEQVPGMADLKDHPWQKSGAMSHVHVAVARSTSTVTVLPSRARTP
jgi:hypothetical protein